MQKTEENALLITARTQACLTQKDVAVAMGVAPDTVSRWELGKQPIPARKKELFLQVCQYFDAAPAPQASSLPVEGYDAGGYPIGWKRHHPKDFKDSDELSEYILSLLEGKEHKERKAFRGAQQALPPAVDDDALRSRILRHLTERYPEATHFPALLAAIHATPAEREAAVELCTWLTVDKVVRVQDNHLTLIGEAASRAEKTKALEAADPGGVKRKAAAKAQAEREHAARLKQAEQEEAEEAKRAENEAVQKLLAQKRVEAKAAHVLMQQEEEEKRFREERKHNA